MLFLIISVNFWLADFKGEMAALLAAFLWAIASVVYGRLGQRIPPATLNLTKGIIGTALLVFTILISGEFLNATAPSDLFLLVLSGVMGIGLGDTAFFAALNSLGARRALLIETLAPPMTALGASIFLQEQLNINAWCGILLTILGVAWVVTERVPGTSTHPPAHLWRGIGFGVVAAVALAAGAILSRAALADTSITPLWAGLLRLSAAVLILLPWTWFARHRGEFPTRPSVRVIAALLFAAFFGTYLGIWLQQTAIKFTAVGIASTLTQTSPLFVLPIAILMGEKVSLRAFLGVVIALVGVAVLFYLR